MANERTTEREPSFLAKLTVVLAPIAVFIGGLYDVGPVPIVVAGFLASLSVTDEAFSIRGIWRFGGTLFAAILLLGIVEWIGRLVGMAF